MIRSGKKNLLTSMSRPDLKSVAVQTDVQCKHCLHDVSKNRYTADISIQTEWNGTDNGGSFLYVDKNIVMDDNTSNSCIVAPTQGIIVPNVNDLQLITDPCNSLPFHSCSKCKFVNNCADDDNLQQRQCPSLPEPACIMVNSSASFEGQDNNDMSDYEPLPESSREDLESLSLNEEAFRKKKYLKRKACKPKTISVKRRLIQKSNYISAGLYSDNFKSDSENALDHRKRPCKVFPKPIHYGKYLLNAREDFLLPHDIWLSRDSTKAENPSLVYKKIRNNIYVDARPVCKDFEPSLCNCTPPDDPLELGCTDNCLNRMVYTECAPNLCACGDRCDNQRIQKHQAFTGLKEFQTKDRGYGVRAMKPLAAGQFIMEYVGEVVSEQEFRRRMTDLYAGMEHHYCLSLDGGTVIDGYRCGNVSRLVNHSCSPNCEMQKWNVNGVPRIGLFARKDIGIKEELTYDYNFHSYNINAQQECKCGSDNCRKVVGGRGQRESVSSEKTKGKRVGFVVSVDRENRSQILQNYCSESGYLGVPSMRERRIIGRKMILLLRNLDWARRVVGLVEEEKESKEEDPVKKEEVFKTQFTAISTSRSVRTRQLTKAEDNDSILRMSFLAQVFMQVYNDVTSCKEGSGAASPKPSYHLPSKRKLPSADRIDLSTIWKNISSGKYSSCISFHNDFMKFFSAIQKSGQEGSSAELMRSQYFVSMENARSFLESIGDVLPSDFKSPPPPPPPVPRALAASDALSSHRSMVSPGASDVGDRSSVSFEFKEDADRGKTNDVIRCICGLYLDEGVMLQCENCLTWQHQVCMNADKEEEDYLCHLCGTRKVSKEIPLMYQPSGDDDDSDNSVYYMTMMRGDLQLRVGEVVYALDEEDLLAFLGSASGSPKSSLDEFDGFQLAEAYKKLSRNVEGLDLYKIEHLWIDEKGRRLMHGHYYLKPRETYHDAGQKFYEKEVLKAPSFASTLPVACAVASCCVMDVYSYAAGRPVGYEERDVYVCEFRVDKNRRTIKKPLKFNYPPNKSNFCFQRFVQKDNFKRTYTPHEMTRLKVKQNFQNVKSKKKAMEERVDSKVDSVAGDLDADNNGKIILKRKMKKNLSKKEPNEESKQKNLESIISKIAKEASMEEGEE